MYVLCGCVCNVCVCVSEGMCVFKCMCGGQKTTWMLVLTFHFESYSTGLDSPQIQGFSCLCLLLSWRSCCYRYIWLFWVLGTPTQLLRLLVCNSLSSIVSHMTSKLKLFSRKAVSVWLCFPNHRSDTHARPLSHNAPWQMWKVGVTFILVSQNRKHKSPAAHQWSKGLQGVSPLRDTWP